MLYNQPIFFEKNRVGRVYRGGALFSQFFSDDSVDGNEPEEWIASRVESMKGATRANEGLSVIKGTNVFFRDLINEYKTEMLGENGSFDVLTKMLDSAIRLPAQTHPTREFAREHFNSEFGKTEMWIVMGKRENAKLYFGFKDGVTREDLEKASEASETDRNAMTVLMNELPVNIGDVYLIPAGIIHAIGAGCLILEVQEPTDFTIEPERFCGDHKLTDHEMYLGLDKKTAFDCFDMTGSGEAVIKRGKMEPVVKFDDENARYEKLVDENDTPCFSCNNIIVKKEFLLKNGPAVYVVTKGEGVIKGESKEFAIKKGDYFFLPHFAKDKFSVVTETGVELAECF